MSFDQLGLSKFLLRAVAREGYDEPTPIQRRAIPKILEGGDVIARAQTGTGKTAAFTLPLLERLHHGHERGRRRRVRAMILTPTRELATQVCDSARLYGRHGALRQTAVYGGVGIGAQIQTLKRGVDIVVATPGRLLDHLTRRTIDLSAVEVLVLDEADRMLDMGFIHDVRKIVAAVPTERQSLLFSATLPSEVRKLAKTLLRDPATIDLAQEQPAAERVSHVIHPVDRSRKTELLSHLVTSGSWEQVLVFTRTKRGADRLTKRLRQERIQAVVIHGGKSQGARTRALADFKQCRTRVLVATDIAARGLDIEQLPRVVNFDLPYVAEDYVHRIGRTGRAGRPGYAVSLVSEEERELLNGIERLLERRVHRSQVEGFEPSRSRQPRKSAPPKPARKRDARPASSNGRRAGANRRRRRAGSEKGRRPSKARR